jgi:hypothetical protein
MMQVEYKLLIGQDVFTLKTEVKDEIEFFKKMSFYSNMPKVGPNGEDDLKIVHRTTKEGYNYYSLVSEKAKMEFKFGQINDKDGGLYPKGWEPLYQKETSQNGAAAPAFGSQAAPQAQAQVAAPQFGTQMPIPQNVATPVQPVVTPTPQAAPVQSAASTLATAPNPQVAQVANNVLARFGIQK